MAGKPGSRGKTRAKKKKKKGQKRASQRRVPRWVLTRALPAATGLLIAWLSYEFLTWPEVAALKTQRPKTTAFIERYKSDREEAGKKSGVAWKWAPYSRIAPTMKHAVLVAEDIGFFSHDGFELREMKQAIQDALREGDRPRGASTITQQLAKNLWLSPSRNPFRKVKEAILTWQLEQSLSKRRILEIYLNVVELGTGVYGVEAAARHYFQKSAAELSKDEASQIAASLPRPKSWHPGRNSEAYQKHVGRVRRRLDKAVWLLELL